MKAGGFAFIARLSYKPGETQKYSFRVHGLLHQESPKREDFAAGRFSEVND